MIASFASFVIERDLGQAVIFIGVFALSQLALAAGAATWMWIIQADNSFSSQSFRGKLILFSTIAYTVASCSTVLLWVGPMFLREHSNLVAWLGIIASAAALLLSIAGKGRGRILTAISAVLLMCSLRFYF